MQAVLERQTLNLHLETLHQAVASVLGFSTLTTSSATAGGARNPKPETRNLKAEI